MIVEILLLALAAGALSLAIWPDVREEFGEQVGIEMRKGTDRSRAFSVIFLGLTAVLLWEPFFSDYGQGFLTAALVVAGAVLYMHKRYRDVVIKTVTGKAPARKPHPVQPATSQSLAKGQRANLQVTGKVTVGVGYVGANGSGNFKPVILMLDEGKSSLGYCGLDTKDLDDSVTMVPSENDGDDAQFEIDVSRVPADVKSLVVGVYDVSGNPGASVYARVIDGGNEQFRATDALASQGGQVLCRIYRHTSGWKVHGLMETVNTGSTQSPLDDVLAATQQLV